MSQYTITLAESMRGKYHISSYEPPLVLHNDDPPEGQAWSTFTPLCNAPAKHRDTVWSSPRERNIIAVWRTFVQKLNTQFTCDKCEIASWNLMKLELGRERRHRFMTIDVPAIRENALEKLRRGGYTIEEAVTEATEEAPIEKVEKGDQGDATSDFIITLLTAGLDRHESCISCSGALVGAERALGTCGHCGRRSRIPA